VNEISEVQQYVGWAIQDCLAEWRKRVDPDHHKTLDTNGALEITMLDQDYVDRFYLSTEQILNKGGLSLVAAHMLPWGMYVMKITR
jgi:hypothetical protein